MESEKELRNKKVLDMHNLGSSMSEISKSMGIGKTSVHSILNKKLLVGAVAPKGVSVEAKLTGSEERFSSFVGFERTNVNEYVHKESGELVRVVFVKGKDGGFGHFVKLKNSFEKSTASGIN